MTGIKPTFQNLVFPDVSYGYVTRFFLGVPSEQNEIGENECFFYCIGGSWGLQLAWDGGILRPLSVRQTT